MAGFISFLKAVGNDFKKGLPIALKVAQAANVGISIANPALGGIINTSIMTVVGIEQKAQAIAAQGTTVPGTQKLAEAVDTLYPAFEQLFGQYGVKIENSHVETYVNAIVAALNAFPALPTAPPPAPTQNATVKVSVPAITATANASTPVPDALLNSAG